MIKIAFAMLVLGQDGGRTRLAILGVLGVLVFLWQDGWLDAFLGGGANGGGGAAGGAAEAGRGGPADLADLRRCVRALSDRDTERD